MTAEEQLYETVDCSNASELIDRLRESVLKCGDQGDVARMAFRGQAHAAWSLEPSAFREGTVLGYVNQLYARRVVHGKHASWDQGNAEHTALCEFLALADRIGLEFPGDHPLLRTWNPMNNTVGHNIGSAVWPPPELFEALAIAQHHGVPTRLLDLTYDPLVAAYFAAQPVAQEPSQIAVWTIDIPTIALASRNLHCSLHVIRVAAARNKNLAAQKGLFMLDTQAFRAPDGRLERLIHELIESGIKQGRVAKGTKAVTKYRLSVREREPLLVMLSRLGVDRAHLMPSFRSVVEELEHRRQGAGLLERAVAVGSEF